MESTAQKKKKLFKSIAVPEAFKRILVDNVGPRASSELMEDLTVQSHHRIRKKKHSDKDYGCGTCRNCYVQLFLRSLMQVFPAL